MKYRLLTIAVLLLFATTSTLAGNLKPRHIPIKPESSSIRVGFDSRHVEVKFIDDADIGLESKGIPSDRSGVLLKTTEARSILAAVSDAGGTWMRMTIDNEVLIDQLRTNAQTNLKREIADLNNYFILEVPDGIQTEQWLDALNALPEVEIALAMPLPAPLPLPGDYESEQGYLGAPPGGIGAWGAYTGGNGGGCIRVVVCDFEYSWNLDHNDIMASYNELIPDGMTPSDPFSDDNHGTAVLGVMGSFNNGWGTTGASHGAIYWAAPTYLDGAWQLGTSLTHVLSKVYYRPGAVFLIEQQFKGPNWSEGSDDGLIPVEWWESWYNTIITCIGNGVTIVECAGNGWEDLDDPVYNTGHAPFLPANHSGAIIVGAGAVPGGSDTDRSRLWFSNWGSRVDVQGWGENVVTTGYSDRYSGNGKDYWYTATFGGTSSAGPTVASAAAILQSIYMEQGGCTPYGYGTPLTPAQVLSILTSTGSPQQAGTYPVTENIGPRPNLTAAIPAMPDNFGACCREGVCTIETEAGCTHFYDPGVYQGDYTTCDPNPCPTGCCIAPSVGDLDQGGGDLGFNYDGADLSIMINGLFIDPTNGWDGICLDEADVDFSAPARPVTDPLTIDGADLSLLIDALFIAPTHYLKNCDGTDNY